MRHEESMWSPPTERPTLGCVTSGGGSQKNWVELNCEGYGDCLERRGLLELMCRGCHLDSGGGRAGSVARQVMEPPLFSSPLRGPGALQGTVDAPRPSRPVQTYRQGHARGLPGFAPL